MTQRRLSFERRISINEIRSLNSNNLIFSSRCFLFTTAVLLFYGLPMMATCVSAIGLMIFPFQTKSFSYLFKDLRKWVLISGFAFTASLGSWSAFELASRHEDEFSFYIFWYLGITLCTLSGGFLVYFLYKEYGTEPDNSQSTVQFLQVRVKVLRGRNLVAKDTNIFGKPTTSDPYVMLFHANNYVGETAINWKTLNPEWSDELFCLSIVPEALSRCNELELNIIDRDKFSSDDNMGTVMVPIPKNLNMKACKWYKVGEGNRPNYCPDPTGDLRVEVELRPLLSKRFKRQISFNSSSRQLSNRLLLAKSMRNLAYHSQNDSMPGRSTRQLMPTKSIPKDMPTDSKKRF